MLAPARAALVDQGRVQRVGAVVDPLAQGIAARRRERALQPAAVLEGDDLPPGGAKDVVDAREQVVGDDAIEALPVVVDHPPQVADVVLPPLEQRLEHVAFVELGIAHQGDHAPGRLVVGDHRLEAEVVLGERREGGDADPEPDRSGREVDVVGVLRARGVRLRATEGAKALEIVAALAPQQVLDGVVAGACVRLDGDPVARRQDVEVQRRHQRHYRRARGLMAADFEAVAVGPDVVGVVDHPRRQPQHLALELAEDLEIARTDHVARPRTLVGRARRSRACCLCPCHVALPGTAAILAHPARRLDDHGAGARAASSRTAAAWAIAPPSR